MLLTKTIGVNRLNCNCAISYKNKQDALFPRRLTQTRVSGRCRQCYHSHIRCDVLRAGLAELKIHLCDPEV